MSNALSIECRCMLILRSELSGYYLLLFILLLHKNFRAGGHFVIERAMDKESEGEFNFT